MIVFAGMLLSAAEKAGMAVPPDPDEFEADSYPHFHIFCIAQLARPMSNWNEHWDNAKVIAALTPEECKTITLEQLMDRGLQYPA